MKTELLAWLINATAATSMASVAVLLLRKTLQRWLGAEIAYRLWIVVPLAAIVAVFSPPQLAATPTPIAGSGFSAAPVLQIAPRHEWIASNADLWLLGVWVVGLVALIGLLVWQQRRYVARMRLRPRADGSWRSGSVDAAPALLGLLRPRLVLPEAFESDYSDDEQRLVIAHERMHQQRRDPWALAACAALRVLFWFNPLLHVAAGCFRRDMEFACDAAVLRRHPDQRRLYAVALLKTQLVGSALPVGCLWHHMPPMKERLMLLKLPRPTGRMQWVGIALVGIAAAGVGGIALAGHAAAAQAADALAAPTAGVDRAYSVDLDVSIDGKHVGHPRLIGRAGDEEIIKLSENGKSMGFRYHVEPQSGSTRMKIVGDVLGGANEHVVGHAQLEETAGTPLLISMNDKDGTSYRIEALVTIAPPQSADANRRMRTESHASAMAAPGEQREIEIIRNGTPAPDDPSDADDMQDELMPGDSPQPGARIEVRREITTPTPSGGRTVRSERRIVMTRNSDGTAPPPPPLPPMAPTPESMPPPPPPMGMRAPTPPVPPTPPPMGMRAPPRPMAMRAPPPPPMHALAPLPPTPDAMQPPPPLPPLPPLPPREDAGNAEGLVELKVLVGIDGHPKQITVVKSQPAGMFDSRAIAAARQWHFNQPMHDGQPVEGWVSLPMHFQMRSEQRVIQR